MCADGDGDTDLIVACDALVLLENTGGRDSALAFNISLIEATSATIRTLALADIDAGVGVGWVHVKGETPLPSPPPSHPTLQALDTVMLASLLSAHPPWLLSAHMSWARGCGVRCSYALLVWRGVVWCNRWLGGRCSRTVPLELIHQVVPVSCAGSVLRRVLGLVKFS